MRRLIRMSFFLLLSCSLLFSCGQGKQEEYSLPKFKQEFSREFEIFGQDLDLTRVSSIQSYRDYLILMGYDAWTKKYLQIVDKQTGAILFASVAQGRGPGEVMLLPWMSLVGQECYLYDRSLQVAHIYDIEKVLQGEVGYCRTIQEREGDVSPIGVFYGQTGRVRFSNESFIQRDSSQVVSRIILDQDSGRQIYNEYPVPDRVRSYWMYMTPYLTFSPDFSKMAVVPAYGAILERFDLSEGISLMGADRFIEPDFTLNGTNPDFNAHAIPFGFSTVTSTNDRIFAGMVAEAVSGTGTRKIKFPLFPVLAVFDWEGHPLIKIRNSLSIECVGYDETEGVVYAILNDADGNSHLGRMKI